MATTQTSSIVPEEITHSVEMERLNAKQQENDKEEEKSVEHYNEQTASHIEAEKEEEKQEIKHHCICGKLLNKMEYIEVATESSTETLPPARQQMMGGWNDMLAFNDEYPEELNEISKQLITQISLPQTSPQAMMSFASENDLEIKEKQQYEDEQKKIDEKSQMFLVVNVTTRSGTRTVRQCYACKIDPNDRKCARYECIDCYNPKSKDCHISYCEICYDLIRNLYFNYNNHSEYGYPNENKKQVEMKSEEDEKIFGEDGFEIRTTPIKEEENEVSQIAETSDHKSETDQTIQSSILSSRETTPKPHQKQDIDHYKFEIKLKKMIIDHKDKTQLHKNDNGNKDVRILYPVRAVLVSKHDDTDPDRVCFVSVELLHLSINEKYETGTAECGIKLNIKLYWFLSEADYIKYNQLQRKNKHNPDISFNAKEMDFIFTPKCHIKNATQFSYNDKKEQQQIKLIDIKEFFGADILANLHSNIAENILFGYMAEITYNYEATIFEPFEIESFPYDCQDIPILIEADNFKTLAPAYFGKKDKEFIFISGDTTNLGRWRMNNTITEFDHQKTITELIIMLKLKRYSAPYLLENVTPIAAVCAFALTAFAIDNEDEAKQERLAIVLGLLLALIFINMPNVPNVTLLHKYYYSSFAYLSLIAIHFAGESYWGRTILLIEDPFCYENADECAAYQKNNYNLLFFLFFTGCFILMHIAFFIGSTVANVDENRKLQMNWKQIKEKVHKKDDHSIKTYSNIHHIKHENSLASFVDIISGTLIHDAENTDFVDVAQKIQEKVHSRYHQSRSTIGAIAEYMAVILLIITAFIVLPNLSSVLQFVTLRLHYCDIQNNEDGEQVVFVVLCGVQTVLCLLLSLYWFDCCNGACISTLVFYLYPVDIIVAATNYVFAIRSFALYFYGTITCDDIFYEDLLYWLFLVWIIMYAAMFGLIYLYYSFGAGDNLVIKEDIIQDKPDGKVKCFSRLDNVCLCKTIAPEYRYFWLKGFTTCVPIIIQYPATILLLLLIGRECNGNSDNVIGIVGSVCLLCFSLMFHCIRAGLQKTNAFFFYFTQFTSCYQIVSILGMHAFVFIDMYWDLSPMCKHSNLYDMLWYCMIIWVLYDNISIIGIMIEFGSPYLTMRVIPALSLLSLSTIASVMVLQLPACIVSLYVLLRHDVTSQFTLSSNRIVSFLIVIWLQILVYGSMQNTKFSMQNTKYRYRSVFSVYFFLLIIYVLSLESFLFWIFVDDITVTSVILSILFGIGILFDTMSLLYPTAIVPLAAFIFYRGKNNMVRAMFIQFTLFISIQMPSSVMQLLNSWTGNVNAINSTEGSVLFVLVWMSLIIQFVYTFLCYDTNLNVREHLSNKFPKVFKIYSIPHFKTYIKYVLYLNALIIWIIIIHCFSFWSTNNTFGPLWWFFCFWIVIYTIASIGPAVTYIWLMFHYGTLTKLVNNVFLYMTVFLYVFIQLPAAVMQLIMIESEQCIDYYGHSLRENVAESYFIILCTLIQLILFYAICDVLGWNDDAQNAKYNIKQEKWRDGEIKKYANLKLRYLNKLKITSEYLEKLGYKTITQLQTAIFAKRKELREKKEKDKFKEKYGKYFLIVFCVFYMIQFGIIIHSFTFWAKSNNQVDCGDYSIMKKTLYWFFLIWIILYSLIPFICVGLASFRDNIENIINKRENNNENNNENKNENNNENNNENIMKTIIKI